MRYCISDIYQETMTSGDEYKCSENILMHSNQYCFSGHLAINENKSYSVFEVLMYLPLEGH